MASIEYRVNDVRSSKLETGLSSNVESLSKVVDTAASKLPSSSNSPSLHAFSKSCSLKEKHLNGFRKIFQFPRGTSVTFPTERCAFTRLTFCVAFVSPSIRFMQLLNEFQITPGQLVLNVWRTIISCMSI